jgi:hypothetical protein
MGGAGNLPFFFSNDEIVRSAKAVQPLIFTKYL